MKRSDKMRKRIEKYLENEKFDFKKDIFLILCRTDKRLLSLATGTKHSVGYEIGNEDIVIKGSPVNIEGKLSSLIAEEVSKVNSVNNKKTFYAYILKLKLLESFENNEGGR